MASPAPYADLTPDRVLDALDALGHRGDGRMIALNSYENRVYQVYLEDGGLVVAKFYRPGRWTDEQILEEHAFVAELAASEIPAVPALELKRHDVRARVVGDGHGATLAHVFDHRVAVFPCRGGRAPELEARGTLEWIGRFIGRIHALGAAQRYAQRPALDIDSFGTEPRAWLLDSGLVPPDLLPSWRAAVDLALDGVRRAWDRAGDVRGLRLHGDCHVGNILWTDAGPHFVDFDDSRTGPAVQDLWMLLSGDRDAMRAQLADLLAGYEQFAELDRRELQLVEALRTLRLVHYSAWIARRWDDPAFPAAFPWFGTQRYWQDRVLELREQIAAMDEPALGPV